jgi:hypothetical protein
MDRQPFNIFIKAALLNLTLVAAIGVLMRYKIGYEFPHFNQKYLLHAHSHFAFSGWVTHTLFTLMATFLLPFSVSVTKYKKLIWANLICAYGMLVSFSYQGYGPIAIAFSTISIIITFSFAWQYYIDLKRVPNDHPSKNWFYAALFFNILSTIGTASLVYMMVTKNIHQNTYLASVYFFLHFQYSGWFFFAIMGLLMSKLCEFESFKYDTKIFFYFFAACIPAYFLSVLWMKLPWYIFIFPVVAVLFQLMGLYRFLQLLFSQRKNILEGWSLHIRIILGLSLLALLIKLSLQTGSIFPDISKLAFGFRSIVIAYLHLVLLGVTTLFLLGFLLLSGYIRHSKYALLALILFCVGVFANELVLTIQGVASFGYILIPYLNETLFGISLFMLGCLVLLLFAHKKI